MAARHAAHGAMLVLLLATCACSGASNTAPTGPSPDRSIVYDAGAEGVTLPEVVREVQPNYPAQALSARVQGAVLVGAIVRADSTLTDVSVLRSADDVYGLDAAAVVAVKQWQFTPGTKDGKAVAVRITIELTFTIRGA